MAIIMVENEIYVVALRNIPEKNIKATEILINEYEKRKPIISELRGLIPYHEISNVFSSFALNNVINENFKDFFDKDIDLLKQEVIYFIHEFDEIKLMELKIISKQIEAIFGIKSEDFVIAVYFYCTDINGNKIQIGEIFND